MENGIAKQIIRAFRGGKKLLIVGNGGSAAQAQHMAAEFVCKFTHKRKPLPAIALTTDTSILTSISNDFDFTEVFKRQVEALGKKGDVLIALSTSGKSKNVLKAIKQARKQGLTVIDLPRQDDFLSCIDKPCTAHIQEFQLHLIHDVCRQVEEAFV